MNVKYFMYVCISVTEYVTYIRPRPGLQYHAHMLVKVAVCTLCAESTLIFILHHNFFEL